MGMMVIGQMVGHVDVRGVAAFSIPGRVTQFANLRIPALSPREDPRSGGLVVPKSLVNNYGLIELIGTRNVRMVVEEAVSWPMVHAMPIAVRSVVVAGQGFVRRECQLRGAKAGQHHGHSQCGREQRR